MYYSIFNFEVVFLIIISWRKSFSIGLRVPYFSRASFGLQNETFTHLSIIVSNDEPIQFFDFSISIVCMPQQIAGNPKNT